MQQDDAITAANFARYDATASKGHYESFFLRANHPTRPLAFWIRYTVFHPAAGGGAPIGELWAVHFDGEEGSNVAVKREVGAEKCRFERTRFEVAIDDSALAAGRAVGSAASRGHRIRWDLAFDGDEPPLFLLPLRLYEASLPKAKSLVALPMARFRGTLDVDGRSVQIDDWTGSQNHNWGERHTDQYAWGQVAGFDTHPGSFLEIGTARLRLGPLWTPFMTPLVLRHAGREHALHTLAHLLRARASFEYFDWKFRAAGDDVRVHGRICAPRESFVGLTYLNPPGGTKHCLNSKLAACTLSVSVREGAAWSPPQTLSTQHRAAFEILTDDRGHGVPILV
ncbi:MAG TPA: hypothetical protein VEC57_19835 [Candidatus Limnocylindrales bacterium]|nr:hypothetical protein [Candidatus Limnocylindrales bacterium]